MDAAERYQRDFDLLMQQAEAEATRRQNSDRDEIWRAIEKSFNAVVKSAGLSAEVREAWRKELLDKAVAALRSQRPES